MNKVRKLMFLVLCCMFLTGCELNLRITKVYSEVVQVGKDFVVLVNNNSKQDRDVSITFEFLNDDDTVVDTVEDSIICMPSSRGTAAKIEGIDLGTYSKYRVTVDSDVSIYKNLIKELKFEQKDNDKYHIFDIENTGNLKMTYIEFLIVYYKNDVAVDTYHITEKDLKAGSKTTIKKEKKVTDYDKAVIHKNVYTEERIIEDPTYDY